MYKRQRCKAVTKKGLRCKRPWGNVSTPQCLQHHRMSYTQIVKRFQRKLYVYFNYDLAKGVKQ